MTETGGEMVRTWFVLSPSLLTRLQQWRRRLDPAAR